MESQTKKPTILYVITQGVWGGAQRYVADLSAEISQNFSVTVAIGEPSCPIDLQNKLIQEGQVALYQLNSLRRSVNPYLDIVAFFELRSLYKKIQPDIVHLNSSKVGIIGSLACIGLTKKPIIVYTVHGWIFNESLPWIVKKIYTLLEKYTARYKDAIITTTQTEKKLGEKILKIAPAKMTVIPLTCTRPLFLSKEKAQKKLTQNEQKNTKEDYHIGTIANFYANKGIDILIRAAELVITQNPQVHLYVIGKGPEEKILRTMVALSPAHNNIHLLGAIPDAAQLLLAFDLFVLPSRKEGLPYALLEAMHAEIPIIATNVGGVAEVIQTYPRGVVVPPENKEILANAILGQLHHTAESQEPTHFLQTFPSITILEFYEQLLIGLRRS
jgi:glycosyltransferase involved in cell wall biosynthesis